MCPEGNTAWWKGYLSMDMTTGLKISRGEWALLYQQSTLSSSLSPLSCYHVPPSLLLISFPLLALCPLSVTIFLSFFPVYPSLCAIFTFLPCSLLFLHFPFLFTIFPTIHPVSVFLLYSPSSLSLFYLLPT